MASKQYLDLTLEKEEEIPKVEIPSSKRVSNFSFKKVFYFLAGLLILFFFYLHFFSFRAELLLKVKSFPVSAKEEITLTKDGVLELANFVLPFKTLEKEIEISQDFPSSLVDKATKAEGMVTVYNYYSVTPLVLVAQTRFLSAEGKLFRSPEKIVIPGKRKVGDKWVPGTVKVRLVAAEPGEEYNIGPTTFSIPGLASSPAYTLVYAKSEEPMRGGFSGKGRMVLQEDLDRAQKVLREKVEKEALVFLEKSFPQFLIITNSLTVEVVDSKSSARAGELKEKFTFTLKAKVKALGIKTEDLQKLALYLLSLSVPEGKEVRKEDLQTQLTLEKDLQGNKNSFKASLIASSTFSEPIKERELILSLLGKSIAEAKILLSEKFEKVKIKVFPFWRYSLPSDPKKIRVNLVLD